VKRLAEEYGTENLIVIFGINQPSILQIMTRTFSNGDPSYAGPLAGIALGLPCYHILELKEQVPGEVWEAEMAMYELEIEEEEQTTIIQTMKDARQG
jgi:betaine reductase